MKQSYEDHERSGFYLLVKVYSADTFYLIAFLSVCITPTNKIP